MRQLLQRVGRSLHLSDGGTAVEYAAILALMILVGLASIATLGEKAKSVFINMANYWQPGYVQVEEPSD